MASGTDYQNRILGLSGKEREAVTLEFLNKGFVPSFAYATVPVAIDEVLNGVLRHLVIQVAPDALAVGNDANWFYTPMWPNHAQAIAEQTGSILPSRKLSRLIDSRADVRLSLYGSNPGEPWYNLKTGTPRRIEDSGAWIASNEKKKASVLLALGSKPHSATLISGHSKDVITGPKLDGKRVRIYGGGGGATDGWAVQPASTIHDWDYGPDYSHSVRLVRRGAFLDGVPVDLYDVFQDPLLSKMVSDEGPYVPVFPKPKALSATAYGVDPDRDPDRFEPALHGDSDDRSGSTGLFQPLGAGSRDATSDFVVLGILGAGLLVANKLR